jgi:hypothetical protein
MSTLVTTPGLTVIRRISHRSFTLLSSAVVLGLLHHTDHVLRGDHSAWPFTPTVTPFTLSLAVYILFAVAFAARLRPGLAAGCVAVVLLFTQLSHLVVELPADQYHTWAHGTNLLGVTSPVLGYGAAALSISLSAVLLAALLSLVDDTRRRDRPGTGDQQ